MTRRTQLKLGAMLIGGGSALGGWRHPEAITDNTDFGQFKVWAAQAEAGKFDLVFVTDGLYVDHRTPPQWINQFEPLTLLAALGAVTSHVGLVGTVSTTYSEPFTIARQLATIDIISQGRAGWNVVTSSLEGAALNYGKPEHPEHDQRYEIAGEHLEVVGGLWDSWEPDTLVADKEADVFIDPAKLHTLNHQGEFFSVKGPLNIERPPQGQPVIFQAGYSEAGRDFAARYADAVFCPREIAGDVLAYAKDVKARAIAYGRSADDVLVFAGIHTIVGETEAEADRKYRQVASLVSLDLALAQLGVQFNNLDLSRLPLDEPFPDLGTLGHNTIRETTERIKRQARENNWTLREVAQGLMTPKSEFTGTPTQIADRMQSWFEQGVCDGFLIIETGPRGLADFVEHVVPVLQRRGVARTEYRGATLRDNLELATPANRYIAQPSQEGAPR